MYQGQEEWEGKVWSAPDNPEGGLLGEYGDVPWGQLVCLFIVRKSHGERCITCDW
jgi:hypothetical protein